MVFKLKSDEVQGIVLVLAGALLLSVMDAVMKVLLERGFSVMQLLAVRSWMIVPAMGLWAWFVLPKGGLTTKRPWQHLIRVAVGFFAPLFFFSSIQIMPLADATVIFFGATFMMTALSVPVLKEKVGPHRWGAVLVGFIGVVIATDPSGAVVSMGAVFAVLSSLAYAVMMLFTRWMGPGEGSFKQVFYFHAWMTVAATSYAFVLGEMKVMGVEDVAWLGLAGAIAISGHLCLTRGFSIAAVGAVAPFEYSALVWATLIGFLVWGHIPGVATMAGATIIVLSGLYLLHRETLSNKGKAVQACDAVETSPPPAAVPVSGAVMKKDET